MSDEHPLQPGSSETPRPTTPAAPLTHRPAGDSTHSAPPSGPLPLPPEAASVPADALDPTILAARPSTGSGSSFARHQAATPIDPYGARERGSSVHRRAAAQADELIDDPTVISLRPPVHAPAPGSPLTPRELGQSLVGRRLAHFQLIDFVGGGGMGAVFRATDTMLNRTVAVKVLSRDQGRDEETVRRFQNEAQSAARLDHDNIARVYYVGEDDGWYFIVFEFIEGQNLRDVVMERGPLTWDRAVQITLQIAEALDHAAHREVVHRDIKPSNVLLTPSGKAKLVDMGLARLRPLRGPAEDLTASGVTLGTFDYISPEQARDPRTADARSDIYSLGCTLFYMLTGRPPFPDGTVLQKLLSHTSDTPPDPRSLHPELPPELSPIVLRMLAKQPAQRYQRAAELIGDLLLLAERYQLPMQTRVEPIWIAPEVSLYQQLQRHLPWVLALLLFIVAALVLDPLLIDAGTGLTVEPTFTLPSANAATTNDVPPDPLSSSSSNARPNGDDAAANGLESNRPVAPNDSSPPSTTSGDSAQNENRPPSASTTSRPSPSAARDASGDAARRANETSPNDVDTNVDADGEVTGSGESDRSPSPARGASPQNTASSNGPGASSLANATTNRATSASVGSKTTASDPSATRPVPATRTLIVDPSSAGRTDEKEPTLASLEEASTMANEDASVSTIEIRHNGPLELSRLTFQIPRRKLTLVAGAGYSPLLSFRTELSDSGLESEGMVRVRGGQLDVRGVHWQMTVPSETLGGEWSLFQIEQASGIRMQDCTVTVQNSYGGRFSNLDNVSFFHCLPSPRIVRINRRLPEARPAVRLDLVNCVLRGEATAVLAREAMPIHLTWTNGLLITSERLMSVSGDREQPRDADRIQITFRNVTAVVDQGLLELTNSASLPHLMPVQLDAEDSLFVSQRWYPLVAQSGISALPAQMNQLNFHGRRNQYDGVETFWKLQTLDSSEPETFDFAMWQSHWNESESEREPIRWRYPPDKNRPLHEHRTNDYAVAPTSAAMPVQSDRQPSGLIATQLPRFPDGQAALPRKTRPLFQLGD